MHDVEAIWHNAASGGRHSGQIATERFAAAVGQAISNHARGIADAENIAPPEATTGRHRS